MRRSFAALALGAVLTVGTVQSAFGFTLNISTDPGTQQTTTGITNFVTTGGDMGGMGVTAYFADGNMATGSWAVGGPTDGSVTLANPSGIGSVTLSQADDTFFFVWTLTSNSSPELTRLVIDAGLGNTVFDRTTSPGDGTAGSAAGKDFAVAIVTTPSVSTDLVFDVTYRDIVALTAQAPVGDLYRILDISFSTLIAGNDPPPPVNLEFTFNQDTDNLLFAGDIGPTPTGGVPEPATMTLLGLGLVGLIGRSMRRRIGN